MRALFGISVLLVAFALARPVLAGPPIISDPFDPADCGETDYAGTLGDPNGAFAGMGDCPGLCRLAELECVRLSKLTFSCQNTVLGKRGSWAKANCKETFVDDPAGLKTCKLDAKQAAKDGKAGVKADQKAAIAACGSWSGTCQNTCVP